MIAPRIAVLLLAVCLVGGASASEPSVASPGALPPGTQEVEVVAVMLDQRTHQPVILMQGVRDKRGLSMSIGAAEATGIAIPLQGVTPPRPLTHDLFLTLFGRLKVTVKRVVITDIRDDVYYAVLHLSANGSDMTLDARPSDAIALALRAKVPVLVDDRVFDKSGGAPVSPRRHI